MTIRVIRTTSKKPNILLVLALVKSRGNLFGRNQCILERNFGGLANKLGQIIRLAKLSGGSNISNATR